MLEDEPDLQLFVAKRQYSETVQEPPPVPMVAPQDPVRVSHSHIFKRKPVAKEERKFKILSLASKARALQALSEEDEFSSLSSGTSSDGVRSTTFRKRDITQRKVIPALN